MSGKIFSTLFKVHFTSLFVCFSPAVASGAPTTSSFSLAAAISARIVSKPERVAAWNYTCVLIDLLENGLLRVLSPLYQLLP